MRRLVDVPGYPRFWAASTVSAFGSFVTILALQILATDVLDATGVELGLMNSARWLPYLLFGLVAGVIVDRYRRKALLVGTDLGRAGLLCAIPALYALDLLSLPVLMLLVTGIGVLSLFFDAADQSILPRLVPPALLTSANARLEQSDAVAQTTGPLVGGALISALGAPFAFVVDAVSYLASGLLLATVGHPGPVGGRMNATIRSLNRGAVVTGAPVGGLVADTTTYRTALWVGVGGLAVAAATLALSPFRYADRDDALAPATSG